MVGRTERKKRGLCPVCLAPLERIAKGTRYSRRCVRCNAVEQPSLRCTSCGNPRVWRGQKGLACKRCGNAAENLEGAGWVLRRDLYGEPDLRRSLCREFPEIALEVQDSVGLVHLQVGLLARLTNDAVTAHDQDLLRRSFSFVLELAKSRDTLHPDVVNALYVSYLEHLDLEAEHRSWALDLMPPLLREMRREVLEYLDELLRDH